MAGNALAGGDISDAGTAFAGPATLGPAVSGAKSGAIGIAITSLCKFIMWGGIVHLSKTHPHSMLGESDIIFSVGPD